MIDAVSLVAGEHVLDIGCGSGAFLRQLTRAEAKVAGVDPSAGMLDLARRVNPEADVRQGGFGLLPWPDATFDVVVAVNALQFAGNMVGGLHEAVRVVRPGGRIGIANWAEARHNDIEVVEAALGGVADTDEDYRCEGGLERLFASAGVTLIDAGVVTVDWHVPDDESLIRGVLSGQPGSRSTRSDAAIVRAARPFIVADGYVLRNAFRFAAGRCPVDP
ncbi:MAG: methyltransferase domain-containing protein [Microbacterium sp.]|uniref:class I SAM-dependent methyltransferase n=1 Tax=Microbacterium sp. TaxID=51671 RepID=UPI001AC7D982|nr:methyltransferase domain-containing protein [Microbacterium sp.]MBN9176970.1 methyltransferase domain-containing protein [Microbacterium sp.]